MGGGLTFVRATTSPQSVIHAAGPAHFRVRGKSRPLNGGRKIEVRDGRRCGSCGSDRKASTWRPHPTGQATRAATQSPISTAEGKKRGLFVDYPRFCSLLFDPASSLSLFVFVALPPLISPGLSINCLFFPWLLRPPARSHARKREMEGGGGGVRSSQTRQRARKEADVRG